ncbi:MAG: hypothetical protein SVV80_01190 [Planctomycetota bacterium]|nr:hypothetical protein [Planctomycetota bacterium]
MNPQDKENLLQEGYTSYKVDKYKPDEIPKLDEAVNTLPCEVDIAGSTREIAVGGRELTCWIDQEDGYFVVYLPPEDISWGSKSQIGTPGFKPSQKGAEIEFHRWSESLL